MKKVICIVLSLIMILCVTGINVCAADTFSGILIYNGAAHNYSGVNFSVYVNSKKITMPIPPVVLENNRSLVPVREICEAIGADVSWISQTTTSEAKVKITKNNKEITLTIGSSTVLTDGIKSVLEAPPTVVTYNNISKTMVPLRFVAETFNMDVDYRAESGCIYILSETSNSQTNMAQSLSNWQENGTDIVKITFSNEIGKYSVFSLENPTRLVFDFKNADKGSLNSSYTVGGNITKIRTGNFDGAARIVFDVSVLPEYEISFENSGKTAVIKLTSKNAATTTPPSGSVSVSGKTVVIDAGHGGSDPGAQGKDANGNVVANEKDVNLAIAKKVVSVLKQKGVNAVFTRDEDVYLTLDERTTYANNLNADLFVSIHCNALTDTSVYGTLVMHHTSNAHSDTGMLLATNILKYLPDAWQTKNRGRMDGSSMYVIRKANMPSVIVENAFITNAQDRAKLTDDTYQQKAAQAIANGIVDTLNSMK